MFADTGNNGDGGDISIETGNLIVRDGAQVETNTFGQGAGGAGGNLTVNAANSIQLIGSSTDGKISSLFTQTGNLGKAGNISLETGKLTISNGAQVSSSTSGQGAGGNLTVNAADSIQLIGISTNNQFRSSLFTQTGNNGKVGNIKIETGNLSVRDGAQISSITSGQGAGGNITVHATDSIQLIGNPANGSISSLFTQTGNNGDGGNLRIETGNLIVRNGAQVSSGTSGAGAGGNLTVKADSIELIGSSTQGRSGLFAQSEDFGKAGNLRIETGSLIVSDGAQVSSGTNGQGAGGNLTVKADSIELIGSSTQGRSGLFAQSENLGDGGNISIETGNLIVRNGAQVSSSTLGQEERASGGNINVKADSIELIGSSADGRSGLFAETRNNGNAGNISIDTGNLSVREGALVSSSTSGRGAGGKLIVNADSIELIGSSADGRSGLFAETRNNGNAGNISIVTGNLSIRDGALISSQSTETATENAGSIDIKTRSLSLTNNGDITVEERRTNVDNRATQPGGSINIKTNSLSSDRGIISAETASTNGGNIDLDVQDLLLLRNNSRISATAGTARTADARGKGGNIDITAKFIFAVPIENSDITANAVRGDGGEVNITAQGIFGIEFREILTSLSDITASSEFGLAGTVQIDAPDTDPSRRVVNLPTLTVEPEVVQACTPSEGQQSEFVITGRGGLPPSASEAIGTDATGIGWVTATESESRNTSVVSQAEENKHSRDDNRIIEAQGWVVGSDGKVTLTAQAPTVTPHIPWLPSSSCQGS
ncbi:S-layer family protein [Candidatus Gracilibacteria bacterium]|nr:S-layer family protein [Candidatus Gracilibacteria bacterium]